MNVVRIRPLTTLDAIGPLLVEAEQQGFEFMRRLVEEWASGANNFDRRGECLLGAFGNVQLLGVAGLNRDPYADADGVGRLRHLYVLASARREGIGSLLVHRIVEEARRSFRLVRLRTTTAAAAAFYQRLGFSGIDEKTASHVMVFATDEKGATAARSLAANRPSNSRGATQ